MNFPHHFSEPQPCPGCGHVLDAHSPTDIKDREPPREGDFTVCFYCALVLRYGLLGELLQVSHAELTELPRETRWQLRKVQRVIRRLRGRFN